MVYPKNAVIHRVVLVLYKAGIRGQPMFQHLNALFGINNYTRGTVWRWIREYKLQTRYMEQGRENVGEEGEENMEVDVVNVDAAGEGAEKAVAEQQAGDDQEAVEAAAVQEPVEDVDEAVGEAVEAAADQEPGEDVDEAVGVAVEAAAGQEHGEDVDEAVQPLEEGEAVGGQEVNAGEEPAEDEDEEAVVEQPTLEDVAAQVHDLWELFDDMADEIIVAKWRLRRLERGGGANQQVIKNN
uniref:HTH_48 domain-containing protein n=1 Tax=Meloidogyne hapla TaxID=6305 RepID=A0A1I8BMY5_MELHA